MVDIPRAAAAMRANKPELSEGPQPLEEKFDPPEQKARKAAARKANKPGTVGEALSGMGSKMKAGMNSPYKLKNRGEM